MTAREPVANSAAPDEKPTTDRAERLRTPSLRARVTWMSLALLAGLLLVLGLTLDTVLSARLEEQLRDRLLDRAGVAESLADQVDAADLATRLEGEGISVRVTTSDGEVQSAGRIPDGTSASDPPAPDPGAGPGAVDPPGPAGPGGPAGGPGEDEIVEGSSFLSVSETVGDEVAVELFADRTTVDQTLGQVRFALVVSALVVLGVAALALAPVIGRALAPLATMTGVAQAISGGDRGRRLRPDRPNTELGRTAVAFDDMLDGLEGAERVARDSEQRLREFVSDAAHELRTPVTGIRATSEHLLRTAPGRAETETLLLTLVREAERAGRLVEDLLLMARIDRGLDLQRQAVDLRELARHAGEARRSGNPDMDFTLTGPTASVEGDPDRLVQVLGNLIDNAINATGSHGRVWVTTHVDAQSVTVDVADDGPGVPEADRERIFERLVRLDPARQRRAAGAGLGLPIARGIARAHSGDLTYLTPPSGIGACFRLTLPCSLP